MKTFIIQIFYWYVQLLWHYTYEMKNGPSYNSHMIYNYKKTPKGGGDTYNHWQRFLSSITLNGQVKVLPSACLVIDRWLRPGAVCLFCNMHTGGGEDDCVIRPGEIRRVRVPGN